MPSRGTYVYGLVRAHEAPALGSIGIAHEGGPGHVHPVCAGSVAALVSLHPSEDPPTPLRPNLEAHHRVIQAACQTASVIPMSFGHVAASEADVAMMLERHEREIRAELDRLDTKVEMTVRVRWNVLDVYGYLVERDRELTEMRRRLFAPGYRSSAAERIELGRLFEERLAERRDRVGERLVASLAPLAVEIDVRQPRDERTAADLAFLVERETAPVFASELRELAAAWPPEYVFRCGGPCAPFHFVDLRLCAWSS